MLRILEAPAVGVMAVDLQTVKQHLNVDFDDDDLLISAFIGAATSRVEQMAGGLVLLSSKWSLDLDSFDDLLYLPRAPISTVSAIRYYDAQGEQDTLDLATYAASIDITGRCAVRLALDSSWPALRGGDEDVSVEFIAGFDDGKVPASLQAAVMMIVGGLYEQRAEVTSRAAFEVPGAVASLIAPYQVFLD